MMLSPADYAAYSRATGRPYPQSEEDKVQMYGDVREFRGNQVKQPQNNQGNSLLNTIAVGAGVLGTGALAAYALRGRRPGNSRRGGVNMADNPLPSKPSSDIQNLARTSAPDIRQAAASNAVTDTFSQALKQEGGDLAANTFNNSIVNSNTQQGFTAFQMSKGYRDFNQSANEIAAQAKITSQPKLNIPETVIKRQDAGTYGGKAVAEGLEASEAKAKTMADSAVESMVEIQESREPIIENQSIDAVNTTDNQVVNKLNQRVQQDTDSIFYGKEAVKEELKFTARDLMNANIPQVEAFERISAAASADNRMSNMLLDPNVSTIQLKQMGALGSSPRFDKTTGRVETNPTYEIKGGASASMGDRPGSRAIKRLEAELDDEGMSGYGDFYGEDNPYEEVKLGGGIEGSAYLKETEGYKERTNKADTFLAGKVQELEGSRPGSFRQERVQDEFIPIRRVEGEESPGYVIKPGLTRDEKFGLKSQRRTGPQARVQAGDRDVDINVTGNKQVGNIDVPEATPYFALDDIVGMEVGKGGYNNITLRGNRVYDIDEALTIPVAGRYTPGDDRVAIQPFMFNQLVETDAGTRQVRRPLYGPLMMEAEAGYTPTALSRTEAGRVLDIAATEFQDPAIQRAYLGATDPDYLDTLDLSQPLVTRPFDETGYKAMRLDEELRNPEGMVMRGRSVGLPVLQDPSAKHRFVSDLGETSFRSQEYGKPVDERGFAVKGAEKEPTGRYYTKGFGGASAMEYEDASDAVRRGESVAFKAPRVEIGAAPSRTAPSPATRTGTQLAETRGAMAAVQPSKVVFQPDPPPDSIDTDIGQVMSRSLAQAGRRRGSRRN